MSIPLGGDGLYSDSEEFPGLRSRQTIDVTFNHRAVHHFKRLCQLTLMVLDELVVEKLANT